jgi:CheY-like chemotaxis protein
MDGYAVCRALKNSAETASLPIVILTARGEPNDRIKGLELGSDDYLTTIPLTTTTRPVTSGLRPFILVAFIASHAPSAEAFLIAKAEWRNLAFSH